MCVCVNCDMGITIINDQTWRCVHQRLVYSGETWPSCNSTACCGRHGPFLDGLPIGNGDVP